MKWRLTAWAWFSTSFGEPVREAGEATHPHSHREVLTLDVGYGDQPVVGATRDHAFIDARAGCGRVTARGLVAGLVLVFLDHSRPGAGYGAGRRGLSDPSQVKVV
jgi:hypothetical protein